MVKIKTSIIKSELKNEKNEFYKHLLYYHTNDDLKIIFEKFVPDGIDILFIQNKYLEQDKVKFKRHSVLEYGLNYGRNGFCVIEKWRGDYFPHTSLFKLTATYGKLIYTNEERGKMPILDLFPELTPDYLDEKIESAVIGMECSIEKNLAKAKREIKDGTKNLDLVQIVKKSLEILE